MDKEQAYDEKIRPLMSQIISICQEHGIAMVSCFAIPVEDDAGLRCTTCLADENDEMPGDIAIAISVLMRDVVSIIPVSHMVN